MLYVNVDFKELLDKTLLSVTNVENEELIFVTDSGETYKLYHESECCEDVHVESIVGELIDLIGSPVLLAEEASCEVGETAENISNTWTFYKLATKKGYVDIRWVGGSNGYYSERVSFAKRLG